MALFLNTYAGLGELRLRLGLETSDTKDDLRMLSRLRVASSHIDLLCGRSFSPKVASLKFDWLGPRYLFLRGLDLLEVTTLTNGDGVVVPSTDYIAVADGPIAYLDVDLGKNALGFLNTRTRALSLLGVWGWHDDWLRAWRKSGQTTPSIASTTATSFNVTDVSGSDEWGMSPCLQVGHLLKIESEYMSVVAISGNTLTVQRGANGSTAATHNVGLDIYVYSPHLIVVECCLHLASYLLRREDAGGFAESAQEGLGGVQIPASVNGSLLSMLGPLVKVGG